jgi:hypothetical protein
MTTSNPGRLVGPWAVAFAGLLAFGWLAPTPVRAGCDHVAGERPALAHFELLDLGEGTPASPVRSPGGPPTAPRPCTGAMCSGSHALPLAPASTIPSRAASQWCLPILRLPIVGPGSVACPLDDHPSLPHHLASGPFRPPRPPIAATMA